MTVSILSELTSYLRLIPFFSGNCSMVTVVDAVNFLKDFDEAKYLQDTGESLGEEDERSVADLLVDQVEFADVLLSNR
mgnify:CR=1 FL=1